MNAKKIECPVCLMCPIRPPVLQCNLGHVLCGGCEKKVDNCPICRTPLGKTLTTRIRNLAVEAQLQKTAFECQNQEAGCGFKGKSPKLELHETDCAFGTHQFCKTLNLGCSESVMKKDFVAHLKERHGISGVESPYTNSKRAVPFVAEKGKIDGITSGSRAPKTNVIAPHYFLSGDLEFVIHASLIPQSKDMKVMVRFVGSKEAAKKLRYEISFESRGVSPETRYVQSSQGPVTPMIGEAVEFPFYFRLPLKAVQVPGEAGDAEYKWSFDVKILTGKGSKRMSPSQE